MPEFLRGLYWMKDLALADIAFCPSLAEWNETTLTARMPVWSSFVVGRQTYEEVPQLILDVSGKGKPWTLFGFGLGENVLIYSIQFTNDTFKEATITPSAPIFNAISRHTMTEVDQTPDGKVEKVEKGDIFDRPSWILGINFESKNYHAVRVVDDEGNIHQQRAKMMRDAENPNDLTYMRYAPSC